MALPLSVCTSLVTDDLDGLSRIQVDQDFFQTTSKDGEFPLHLVALHNSVKCLEFFLSNAAELDVNMNNNQGRTSLHISAFHGHVAIVKRLVSIKEIQVNRQSKGNGCTALYLASCGGHAAVVEVLLRAGADPNITTESNSTPLIAAAFSGNLSCVQLLVQSGAKMTIQNDQGFTPIRSAAAHGHTHIVEYLLSQQPDLEQIDKCSEQASLRLTKSLKESCDHQEPFLNLSHEGRLCFEKSSETPDKNNSDDQTITLVKNVIEKIMVPQMKDPLVKTNLRGGRRKHEASSPNEHTRDSSTHSGSRSAGDLSDKSNQTTVTEILV